MTINSTPATPATPPGRFPNETIANAALGLGTVSTFASLLLDRVAIRPSTSPAGRLAARSVGLLAAGVGAICNFTAAVLYGYNDDEPARRTGVSIFEATQGAGDIGLVMLHGYYLFGFHAESEATDAARRAAGGRDNQGLALDDIVVEDGQNSVEQDTQLTDDGIQTPSDDGSRAQSPDNRRRDDPVNEGPVQPDRYLGFGIVAVPEYLNPDYPTPEETQTHLEIMQHNLGVLEAREAREARGQTLTYV